MQGNTWCLPVKVSAAAHHLVALNKDEKVKAAFNKTVLAHLEMTLAQRKLKAFDESDDEKTLEVELTKETLAAGTFVPVIIYSALEDSAFRHKAPYAN
ncbi:hypothetical protein [Candidatus Finniella inopinata]|uniref:Uncharacterized protein n=1 Tax=Candidatus Finniella inopinata TaxID=1696036 RepID=A0A4Q7DHR0_9PROT|nr:hypothetical protein [Candidatus Finniella inopinata]RZI45689.1 hypothetical protein EQU50_06195 [Candidatus Finniella inopinata]